MCSTWTLIYNAWNLVLMIDYYSVWVQGNCNQQLAGKEPSTPGRAALTPRALLHHLPKLQSFWALFQSAWLAKVNKHQLAPSGPSRAYLRHGSQGGARKQVVFVCSDP